jgi:hypothetical protein
MNNSEPSANCVRSPVSIGQASLSRDQRKRFRNGHAFFFFTVAFGWNFRFTFGLVAPNFS